MAQAKFPASMFPSLRVPAPPAQHPCSLVRFRGELFPVYMASALVSIFSQSQEGRQASRQAKTGRDRFQSFLNRVIHNPTDLKRSCQLVYECIMQAIICNAHRDNQPGH